MKDKTMHALTNMRVGKVDRTHGLVNRTGIRSYKGNPCQHAIIYTHMQTYRSLARRPVLQKLSAIQQDGGDCPEDGVGKLHTVRYRYIIVQQHASKRGSAHTLRALSHG